MKHDNVKHKLKNCPFCRSTFVHVGDNRKSVFVECEQCNARPHEVDYCEEPEEVQEGQMGSKDAVKEVIRRWNRRASWLGDLYIQMRSLIK